MPARCLPCCLFAVLLLVAPLSAENWPRWRGPADNGSIDAGSYPTRFSAADGLRWKRELPGRGCSTPVVWGEQIVLTCTADGRDTVAAYSTAGKPLWQTQIGEGLKGKHRNGSGSNPSPVTDGKRVFVCFKGGNLAALDMAGKQLWSVNLIELFGKGQLYWDFGTSPVLTQRDVVMAVMTGSNSYVVAFDQATGKQSWRVDRQYKTPVEGDHSYATPIVVRSGDQERILIWGAERFTAHDAGSGKTLWECGGFNPEEKGNWVVVSSFVLAGDMAVIPYGRGSRMAGIKLGGTGDVTATHRKWTRQDTGCFVPTPCVWQGKVYMVRDQGEVVCLDAQTGETLWEDRFPKHRMKFYASPLVAGGTLYAPREDGTVLVARVGEKFEFVGENELGEQVIASPVPLAGGLLIRGEKHLFCVGK